MNVRSLRAVPSAVLLLLLHDAVAVAVQFRARVRARARARMARTVRKVYNSCVHDFGCAVLGIILLRDGPGRGTWTGHGVKFPMTEPFHGKV
eukprot:7378971-Prymnesium_polylepis.1